MEAEINVLRTEANVQARLRQAINPLPNESIKENVYNEIQLKEIAVLEASIRQLEEPLKKQIRQLELKQSGEDAGAGLQIAQLQQEISMMQNEKGNLVLVAPNAGLVADLPVNEGESMNPSTWLLCSVIPFRSVPPCASCRL